MACFGDTYTGLPINGLPTDASACILQGNYQTMCRLFNTIYFIPHYNGFGSIAYFPFQFTIILRYITCMENNTYRSFRIVKSCGKSAVTVIIIAHSRCDIGNQCTSNTCYSSVCPHYGYLKHGFVANINARRSMNGNNRCINSL